MNKDKKYYKVFNQDLTCREFQYKIGKEAKLKENQRLEICKVGFHFCDNINDTLRYNSYYQYNHYNHLRLCEVEPLGKIIKGENKYVTDHIKILRELTFEDIFKLDTTGQMLYYNARYIDGVDIKRIEDRLIEIGEYIWLFWFIDDVKGVDIKRIEKRLEELSMKDKYYS